MHSIRIITVAAMFLQSDAAWRSSHMIRSTDQNRHCHKILALYINMLCSTFRRELIFLLNILERTDITDQSTQNAG